MATVLADSPPAPASELGPAGAPPGAPELPPGGAPAPAPADHSCANCGSAMAPGQDWCLQCGAGAPGSVGSSPGWRSALTILGVAAVFALGAAAAAYAALTSESSSPHTVTTTVAQATVPPATIPTTPTTATVPSTPSVKSSLPLTTAKPPKIPLTATPTPTTSTPTSTPTTSTPTETTPASKPTPAGSPAANGTEETQIASILLDTNAASTYNPYNYPESDFGDPSLTIDGDTSTGWTAVVEPSTAPKMAEGVLIDLKSPHKLSAVKLVSTSPGMTVQIYGTAATTAPTSITDPAWIPLSHSQLMKKKHVRIKLRDQKKSFTNVVVWISQAPAASVGTPQAPGHVSLNEIELFPTK